MKVAIYVRVSTTEQAQEGYSIPAQTSLLRKYSESFNYIIFDVYQDAGISGKNIIDRPGLLKLIEDAKCRKFDAVLIWKLSRLSRSLLDLLNIVDDLKNNNVSLISYSEHFDTSTPIGKMLLQLLGSIAEFERNTIVENVIMGMNERFKQGLSKSSIPFGYEYDGKNTIVITEKATVVKEIFDRYSNGSSIIPLVTYMNSTGFTNRNGRPWRYEVVLKMLQNEFYLGYVTTGRKDLKKSNFEIQKGIHIPIIEEEIFKKVQKRIETMKKTSRIRKTDAEQLFSGIAICPYCGNRLYYVEAKNYYNGKPYITPIYRCGASNPNRNKCRGFSLSLRKVDEFVLNRLKWLINQETIEVISQTSTQNDVSHNKEEQIASLEQQIQESIKIRNKYFDLFESGKVDMYAFADRINNLLQKIDSLQSEKDSLEKELNIESIDIFEVFEGIRSFIDIYDELTPQERREVIRTLVTDVIISEDKVVTGIRCVGGFSL